MALARAMAISPGLLLLDEPLSALDAKVRVHLRHEIKELQRKLGVTTIMVTHDQEEALSMADRIVVMNHGVIEQVGTPTEIYRDPQDAVRRRLHRRGQPVPGARCSDGGRVALDGSEMLARAARAAGRQRGHGGDPAGRGHPARRRGALARRAGRRRHAGEPRRRDVSEMEFLGAFWRCRLRLAAPRRRAC